ncbi:hypothetical protein CGCF413_v013795 [Colletotrichum fructicola]|nr:hypothetical protein CFRS1_v000666 [Colletotrichum fructicola]KAF5485615.1 hypothetical protein CGCF413_v013795 [Colletotrichum fructicola]
MPSSSEMNRYWIPRLDIHKKIITQELPYYLGPDATVRPYTNEGEDGFLITTPGPCLTDVSLVVACPCLAQNSTSGIDVTMIGDVNDVERFGGAGLK